MKQKFINTLDGLDSLSTLYGLETETSAAIRQNQSAIKKVLERAQKLNGLGKTQPNTNTLVSTSNVLADNRLNPNISEDEIKAWVYYKRSQGVPMHGWEKYFFESKQDKDHLADVIIYTKCETSIFDENGASLGIVPTNSLLGKQVMSNNNYNYAFIDKNGNKKYVPKDYAVLKQTYTDEDELIRLIKVGALFYRDGVYLPLPVFVYGNIYLHIAQLTSDEEFIRSQFGNEIFENHKKILENAKPKVISFFDPILENRPQISPISEYAHHFKINDLEGYDFQNLENRYVDYDEVTDEWYVTLYSAFEYWLSENRNNQELFEKNVSAYQIITYYLHKQNFPRGTDEEVKKEIKKQTRYEAERLFPIFIERCITHTDKQRLDMDWNIKFNAHSTLRYDKIPIAFAHNNKFKGGDFELRPAQREGVAFMELTNSGCISFDVGVGKTMTAISELAMALETGKCKRPLLIVPNSTFNNWISELFGTEECPGVLFGTKVKLNKWYNLGSDIDISSGVEDNTITLVTYEGLKKIGFSDEVGENLIQELIRILLQDFKSLKPKTQVKALNRIKECVGIGNKNSILEFDKCGFDYICMDEAHNAKNVFCSVTTQGQKAKFNQQSGSMPSVLALKMFLLGNYCQRKNGGNVMLLTATPFTNSPLEMYSMLAHIAYEDLKRYGVENIEVFCETFINEQTETVVDAAGDLTEKAVVKEFRNRIILQQLLYNHFNYKTGEEAGVKRPCKINIPLMNRNGKRLDVKDQILTFLTMTSEQAENQSIIKENITKGLNANNKEDLKGLLKGMAQSLDNAFSPYLFDKLSTPTYEEFVAKSPKIEYTCKCIKSVIDYCKEMKQELPGQVIFSNRGKDYFRYIKEYLEYICGFKTNLRAKWSKLTFDEVQIVSSDNCNTSDKKYDYMRAYNEGIIKVMIGTATIREGVNLQTRSTVLYNLYPDWNPTNVQQLEGRIWRQGNKYQFVRIVMPLVANSMDNFVFQKLEEKTTRINDIWYRAERGNVLNIDSLDPKEIKLALVTDIDQLVKTQLKEEHQVENRNLKIFESQIKELNEYKQQTLNIEKCRTEAIKRIENAIKNMEENVDVIVLRPTEEQMQKIPEKKRNDIKRTLEIYDSAKVFLQQANFDDKDILKISQKIDSIYSFDSYYSGRLSEMVKKMVAVEKRILEPKGLNRNSDIDKVIEDLKSKTEESMSKIAVIDSPTHYSAIYEQIEQQKLALNIIGKSVKERVKEFTKTNYVMDYPFNPALQIPNNTLPESSDFTAFSSVSDLLETELQLCNYKTPTKKFYTIMDKQTLKIIQNAKLPNTDEGSIYKDLQTKIGNITDNFTKPEYISAEKVNMTEICNQNGIRPQQYEDFFGSIMRSEEDVILNVANFCKQNSQDDDKMKRIRIAKAKAKALSLLIDIKLKLK